VREASQFTAALAFVLHLPPDDALEQLQIRAVGLEGGIAAMQAIERGIGAHVGRVSVLELEYLRALAEAELTWVRSLIDDLRTRRLTWNIEDFKNRVVNPYTDMNNIEASSA